VREKLFFKIIHRILVCPK